MKYDIRLTEEQQKLVEEHLCVVYWVIRESIHVNETIYGLGYEDLYQEGCIWLCRAAASYDASRAQFATYAKKVIRNGLCSYCRQICGKQSRISYLSEGEHGELMADGAELQQSDDFRAQISRMETLELLKSRANAYSGVAKLGIEALELKITGLTVTEIAQMYDVPASHVGAWISRSVAKLRKDKEFMAGIL